MSEVFWLNNPKILFNKNHITEIWITQNMTQTQKLNAISRFVILLTTIGYMFLQKYSIVIIGLITLGIICVIHNQMNQTTEIKETFDNLTDGLKSSTAPTTKNPLMNVMMNEYNENPTRPGASDISDPITIQQINSAAKELILETNTDNTDNKKLFNDMADEYDFEQSMRPFHSTANTLIPNDQKGFTDFCYGTLPSEKNTEVH